MSLSEPQIQRYARHILLPDIGGVGQARLLTAAARVTVGPARCAGAVAAAYLAAAGLGTMILVDDGDGVVTEREVGGNILLGPDDVGAPRIEAMRRRLEALNPDVRIVADAGDEPQALSVRVDEREGDRAEPHDVAAALIAGGGAAMRAILALSGRS
jgi:molybdopterin/thiamine biosynthesis adenylyltransferase